MNEHEEIVKFECVQLVIVKFARKAELEALSALQRILKSAAIKGADHDEIMFNSFICS